MANGLLQGLINAYGVILSRDVAGLLAKNCLEFLYKKPHFILGGAFRGKGSVAHYVFI